MKTSDIVPFNYDRRFSPEMTWVKVKKLVPVELEEIMDKIEKGANVFVMMNPKEDFVNKDIKVLNV